MASGDICAAFVVTPCGGTTCDYVCRLDICSLDRAAESMDFRRLPDFPYSESDSADLAGLRSRRIFGDSDSDSAALVLNIAAIRQRSSLSR